MPPSLGSTPGEIYAAWRAYPDYGFALVLGYIPGEAGTYDWREGRIWRSDRWTSRGVATARPATTAELEAVEWAIQHGCFQIELRPPDGVCGAGWKQGMMRQPVFGGPDGNAWVLHQATGKALKSAAH